MINSVISLVSFAFYLLVMLNDTGLSQYTFTTMSVSLDGFTTVACSFYTFLAVETYEK